MSDKRDTLIGACITRAAHAHIREELDRGRDPDKRATKRETMRALWSSTQDGSKVAALIVLWAIALQELNCDELGIEEFAEWCAESRSTAYRRQAEFRRLFPEYDTPNEVARALAREARRRRTRPAPDLTVELAAVA